MLRWWLDEVGDGVLAGSMFATLTTGCLAGLALLLGVPAVSAPEADPVEVAAEGDTTVRMLLPLPVAEEVEEEAVEGVEELPAPAARPEEKPVAAVAQAAGKPGVGSAKGKKGRRCDPDENPWIQALGPARWVVDRELVRQYTRDWGRLDELGWSSVHEGADGKADGMRIGGVRCGSDLYDAGIRSGDVVHRVNGRAVKNLAQALLVYAAVKDDPVVEVELTRRGERRTLTYELTRTQRS